MTAKVSSWSAVLFSALVIILFATGCGGGSSSTASNITATPTFSPGGGTYTSSQPVTISDATSGAVLYCTTDGTTPTSSSPKCSQPTTVFQTEFLQAIAVAPGKSASAMASAGYVISLKPAPAPTFNPTGGAYSGAQQVTISDSLSGANLYYTLDGSTPTANSTLYTGPVTISQSATLNAIASATGYTSSAIATAAYTIQSASLVPTVSSLSPTSAPADGAAFTLTINGTNFDSASTVKWGSTALTTTFVSATKLTAAVPASLLVTPGSVVITVTTSAGTSAYAAFTVNPALPGITSLSPSSAAAGGAGFTLMVTGTSFDSSAKINWNGSALTTTFVNATSLTAPVPASLIADAGSATVTVTASAGTSNNLTFNITSIAAVPTVTALNPASGAAGTSVTVTGTNFTGATVVNFGTTSVASFAVNSAGTSITTTAPAGTGTVDVTVVTPNGTSAVVTADQYTYPAASGTPLSGFVLSGTSASAGLSASVQLYAAGTTAYGPVASPGATKLGSAVQTNPATGAFTVTYDCSTAPAPGDQLYLVATGSNNQQAVLMTALGSCGNLQSGASYTINEATTVASVYALQQFMAADGSIGAAISAPTSLSYTGLSNAFKTVNNLVDPSSGTVRDHTPAYTTNFAGDPNIVNNSTVPQARINTLANALNACVSNSSGCSSLFTAATAGSGAPANTLQAILNIAQNPGNNVSDVYTAATGTAYTPTLLGAPNDWTLALTFTGGGLGIAPSISGVDALGTPGVGPNITTALAIDASGNVFVAGYGENGYPAFANDTFEIPILAEFNNLGAPQTSPTQLSSDATPVITFGGSSVGQTVTSSDGSGLSSVAIDNSGNIWAGDFSSFGGVYTVSPGPGLPLLASDLNIGSQYSVAIDNNNNAWAGNDGFVGEFTYMPGNSALQGVSLSYASTVYNGQLIYDVAFDSASNLWAYSSGSAPTILQAAPSPDGGFIYSAYPTRGTASSQAMSLAADNMGNVFACGDAGVTTSAGTTLDVFTEGLVTSGSPPTTTYPLGSRGCGEQLLLDGQGHLFAISNGFGRSGQNGSAIDEYTTAGVAISPANGYTGTSSAEQPTITIDGNGYSIGITPTTGAIDGSGNLWLINKDTSNSGGSGCAAACSTGNVLVEFIGIATPVVTPTSAALVNGELGARP